MCAQPDACTHKESDPIPDIQPDAITHAEPDACTYAEPYAIAIESSNALSHANAYAVADDADAVDGPERIAHRRTELETVWRPVDLADISADERCRVQLVAAVDCADAGTLSAAEPAPDDRSVA